ncbi:unnamed protein product, partial [marine sediment metagenome]
MAQFDEFVLTYIQSVHSTRITNVLNYQQTSADGTGDARLALATAFLASSIITEYKQHCGMLWTDLCVEVRQSNLVGQDFFRVITLPNVGTGGDTLNPASAVQIILLPSTGGPGQQGSVYISGAPITYEDQNNLT